MTTDQLTESWLRLWNGDLDQAATLVTNDFRVHAALPGGVDDSALVGPGALLGWIAQIRAAFVDLRFAVQVGPIADGDHLALRWTVEGEYSGGYPGARAPVGTVVVFTGTDVLRVVDGRLAEYWVNSDVHVLLARLQVSA